MAHRDRAMTVAELYGRPRSSVVAMEHGLLRKHKPHLIKLTDAGEFRIHRTAEESSELIENVPLKQILSVGRLHENDGKNHTEFVVSTPSGTHTLIADTMETMRQWIITLNPPMRTGDVSSAGPSLTGWLGVGGRKEAWCALRKTSLVYFNKKEDQDPTGAIALDSLCTVVPPEQTSQGAGRRMTLATKSVSFTLNTAKKQWVLKTKTLSDANRWIAAIQDVIECCPRLTTKFEKYVNACLDVDAFALEEIMHDKALLCYSDESLDMPLTPLPYGSIGKTLSGNEFTFAHIEAMRLFDSTIPGGKSRFGHLEDAPTFIRNVLQVYMEVPMLRTEIFCQAVKQVSKHPYPERIEAVRHWWHLSALCAHFTPSGKYLTYIRNVLRMTVHTSSLPHNVRQMANFCLQHLQAVKSTNAFDPKLIDSIVGGSAYSAQPADKLVFDVASTGGEEC